MTYLHIKTRNVTLTGAHDFMFENVRKFPQMLAGARRPKTRRFTLTLPEEMAKRLEEERKRLLLDSISATVRTILSEYLTRP
jgi:hypothetical protein